MIEVRDLTKRYGDLTAVDRVSFTIEKGHVYGLLGPNGAGKSTTMNMITGCLSATSGSVRIGGHDILTDPVPEVIRTFRDESETEVAHHVDQRTGGDLAISHQRGL